MSTDAGFLNDLNLDQTEADPNYISDGPHPGFIFDSKVVTKKDGNKSWVLTHKVAPEDTKFAGRIQDEWYPITNATEQNKSWLKRRVLSLGVPESQVGSFSPADVIGLAVLFSIRHKDSYQNVVDVVLRDEATGQAMPAAGSAPAQAAPEQVTGLL